MCGEDGQMKNSAPILGKQKYREKILHILLHHNGNLDRNSRSHNLRYSDSQKNLIPCPSRTRKEFKKQKDISKVWSIIETFIFLLLFYWRIFQNSDLFYHIGSNNTGLHATDGHLVYPMKNASPPVSCWASPTPFLSKGSLLIRQHSSYSGEFILSQTHWGKKERNHWNLPQ